MRPLAWGARVSILAVLLAIGLLVPAIAQAAPFNVTKVADTNDGTCDADCSLREAVVAANGNPGADTISVPAGHYTLTIAGSGENLGATGDLDITDDVTITGAGAGSTTVDAGGDSGILDRVFDQRSTASNPSATISGMTITGGRAPTGNGGGVNSDSLGNTTLDAVVLSGNEALAGEGGGAVENGGGTSRVLIRNSVVTGNRASVGGGASENGGATDPSAEVGLVIERSAVVGNTATNAGGGVGGGVVEDGAGEVTVRDSTISGNRAEGNGTSFGGGYAADGGGTSQISNTTISGNTASGPDSFGGGYAEGGGGTVALTNVTIAENSIEGTGTTPQHAGANVVENGAGTTTFKNSIVSAGAPANCVASSGTIASSGNNLDSGSTCGFASGGDQSNADPLLGPLADNGGPTQTRRLLNGSPAIDTGDNAACPATDQRGVARPQPAGGTCDKGAVERLTADAAVTLAAPASRTRGESISYAVTVTNRGPSTASGVVLTDALPAGLAQPAASTSAGTCAVAAQVQCNLGDLASGATATVTITATTTTAGVVSNSVSVAQGTVADDPDPTNNAATAQTTVNNRPALVPVRGKTVLVAPVKGIVRVAVPVKKSGRPAAKPPARGFTNFRRLKKAQLIPVTSIVDTSKGIVRMQSARNRTGTSLQSGNFSRGQFQVKQSGSSALTTLALFGGGDFKRGCRSGAARSSGAVTARRRPRRSLFSNARGAFRTRGRNSVATVRGTKWLTKDTCAGTLTVVSRGSVVVRDLRKHRTITVRAGRRYLARSR